MYLVGCVTIRSDGLLLRSLNHAEIFFTGKKERRGVAAVYMGRESGAFQAYYY